MAKDISISDEEIWGFYCLMHSYFLFTRNKDNALMSSLCKGVILLSEWKWRMPKDIIVSVISAVPCCSFIIWIAELTTNIQKCLSSFLFVLILKGYQAVWPFWIHLSGPVRIRPQSVCVLCFPMCQRVPGESHKTCQLKWFSCRSNPILLCYTY